jgi:hypothetical protein
MLSKALRLIFSARGVCLIFSAALAILALIFLAIFIPLFADVLDQIGSDVNEAVETLEEAALPLAGLVLCIAGSFGFYALQAIGTQYDKLEKDREILREEEERRLREKEARERQRWDRLPEDEDITE